MLTIAAGIVIGGVILFVLYIAAHIVLDQM